MIPAGADKVVFLLAPLITSILALAAWAVVPIDFGWALADVNVGILYIFAISSLSVYGIIMGGWASNNKYGFLGALRSAAQMVSLRSLDRLRDHHRAALRRLAEPHRHRGRAGRDGPRLSRSACRGSRSSTGSGCRSSRCSSCSSSRRWPRPTGRRSTCRKRSPSSSRASWSSTPRRPYLLFMLGEYIAIIMMCALTTILFLGGWAPPVALPPFTWIPGVIWFVLKLCLVFFMIAMVKAFVPRYRYDQLMRIGWKVFLPLSLFMVIRRRLRSPAHRLGLARRCRLMRIGTSPQRPAAPRVRIDLLSVDALLLQAQADDQLPLREGPRSRPASAASTRSAAIPTAKSAASPASSARRSARRRRSPSRPARARTTAPAAPCATTSTW